LRAAISNPSPALAGLRRSAPSLLTASAQALLAAANTARGLPLQNLAQGTTTQSVRLSQQIAGGAIGGLGLLGALAGLPTAGGLPAGGSGLPWTYTFQNSRWTPTV
jgi:hypothetical protein